MTRNSEISYLDYNATAPVLPSVARAVADHISAFGNPSSVHRSGREARSIVEAARESVAELAGANAQDIIFTSGGTEANALAIRGLVNAGACGSVLASAVEHPSVLAHVNKEDQIAVNEGGQIDLRALEGILKTRESPVLISLMLANNETGILQPIAETVQLAKEYGALVHCDAVQAPGKVPINFQSSELDAMTLSAHKFGGLKGAGALVLKDGLPIAPDIFGGGQERGRRAGTENVVGILAFGSAARFLMSAEMDLARIRQLRNRLEAEILGQVPQARIVGHDVERLGNTCCVIVPGVSSEIQLMKLDLANVAISAGSACSSGKVAPSHVLLAMGIDSVAAKCATRISFGWGNVDQDVDRFLHAWLPLVTSQAV